MTVYQDILAKAHADQRKNGNGNGAKPAATAPVNRVAGQVPPAGRPVMICASDVEAENVSWLWPGRIPLGKLTILEGDPGLGKSTIAFDVAARLTIGAPMPDGSPSGEPAGVVILTAEDGYGDTVRPRLEAAGADLSRVHFFDRVELPDQGFKRAPVFPADLLYLEQVVLEAQARFVIVDPLFAYLSAETNTWNDAQTRQALAPLADLADRLSIAPVVIRHWNKREGKAMYRGGGSIGLTGAARSVLLVAPDPDDDMRRILAPVKANLSELAPALAYRIEVSPVRGPDAPDGGKTLLTATRIAWLGPTSHKANDLSAMADDQEATAQDEAATWLEDALGMGPVKTVLLQKLAREAGHTWRTVQRAKDRMGVVAEKERGSLEGGWRWRMPGGEDSQGGQYSGGVAAFGDVGSLRDKSTTYKTTDGGENTKVATPHDIGSLRFPPALPAMPGDVGDL